MRARLGRSVSVLCAALILVAVPAFAEVAFVAGPSMSVPRRGSPTPEPLGGFGAGQPSSTDPAPTQAPSTGPSGGDQPGPTEPPSAPTTDPGTDPAPTAPEPTGTPAPSAGPTTTVAPAPLAGSPGAGNPAPAPIPVPSAGGPTTPSSPLRGGGDVIPAPRRVPNSTSPPAVNAAPAPTLPPNALLDLLSRPGLGAQLVVAGTIGLVISVGGLIAVGWRRARSE